MKKIIIGASVVAISQIYGLVASAGTLPVTAPSISTAPVDGIWSQFFQNLSTDPVATNTNPIIVGFNNPTSPTPLSPIYLTDSEFITAYLKTIGLFGGDRVLNGFDGSGNPVTSSMDTLVKGFLGATYSTAPSKHGITGFDASGNMITSQNIGYWDSIGLGISYPGPTVSTNGGVRLYGNATTNDASIPNHLVTYGQIQTQSQSIKDAIP